MYIIYIYNSILVKYNQELSADEGQTNKDEGENTAMGSKVVTEFDILL